MPYERIALALKHDMAKRGIDQTSLGEAIGLTQQAVSGWLQDKKGIRTKSLRLLADYFGPASECAALLARTKTKQEYTPAAPANSAPREKYDIPPATAPLHVSDNRVEYTSMERELVQNAINKVNADIKLATRVLHSAHEELEKLKR